MSKYTTELRFICESLAGYVEQQGYGSVDDILTTAAPLVFDFDFPIFDEDYRLGLEKKILKHFYTREISEETVGLWKLRLNERMNLIMPLYNQMYESELIEFDPMQDTGLVTSHTKDIDGSTTNNSSSASNGGSKTEQQTIYNESVSNGLIENTISSKDTTEDTITAHYKGDVIASDTKETGSSVTDKSTQDAYSDTPQGSLENMESLEYLTNARIVSEGDAVESTGTNVYNASSDTDENGTENVEGSESGRVSKTGDYDKDTSGGKNVVTSVTNTGSSNVTGGGTSNSIEEYIQHITGKRSLSSFSKYLTEFRQTFLNIDSMVINELNDLFINLW